MVFDHTLFERYIERRASINQPVSILVKWGYFLFKSKIFCGIISFSETLLMFVLNLPIPIYRSLINGLLVHLPGTPYFLGVYLRAIYYKGKLKYLGKNVIIEEDVKIISPQDIEIHDQCIISKGVILAAGIPKSYNKHRIIKVSQIENEGQLVIKHSVNIASYTTIGGSGGMTIGECTGIGPHCSIYSYTHLSMNPFVACESTTKIGANVAIGTNSSLICIHEIPEGTYIKPNTFLSSNFLSKGK